MAVLSRSRIQERLKLPIDDPGGLVITPILDTAAFDDADSVDLRLGCHFLLPKSQQPLFSPDEQSSTSLHDHIHVPWGKFLVVPAHQTVLGATLEFVKLPYDLSGEILTKSSVARTFILIETAPWIHPLYRGCLTLEIANVSNTPVLLYPGRFIGQLILMQVDGADNKQKLDATYFGPTYPEAPKFKNPATELHALGFPKVALIKHDTSVR